jgi:polysaccharide biosynthesis/export protein VpsN
MAARSRAPAAQRSSRRSWLVWSVLCLLACMCFLGCKSQTRPSPGVLEAPTDETTLGPGDRFRLQIVGEPELPTDYQVGADGTVTLPFVQRLEVAGLEPNEVAALVRSQLVAGKVLSDPSVIVTVLEYRSKRVTVLGQVQKPGSFTLEPGMTLLQALSQAGGLTSLANVSRVNLTRTSQGKATTVVVNIEAIYEGNVEDIPLQPGDRVFVHERNF